jgi:hypothetical protein
MQPVIGWGLFPAAGNRFASRLRSFAAFADIANPAQVYLSQAVSFSELLRMILSM